MKMEGYVSRRNLIKGTVAALGGAGLALAGCSKPQTQEKAQLMPGTYTGAAMGRAGEVVVELTVKNNCVVKAAMVASAETAVISENAAKKVLGDIVEHQTLNVDTVSGATLTSMAVRSAAEEALSQAGDISAFESPADYPTPECEDCACDVVVIGAGSAGMNAASRLADEGANVILVEKQGFLGGGDTMFASSGLAGGGGYTVYKNDIEGASEQDYLNTKLSAAEKSGLPVDIDCLTAYSLRSGDAVDAYISIGVPFGKFAKFSNTTIDGSSPGTHIIKHLSEQMDAKGIDYRLNTSLVSIAQAGDEVTGVVVANEAGQYAISADAVLLACGGFGNNEEMLTAYADAGDYCGLPHSGSASAMGDGILAAEAIGAALGNMTAIKANNICHITDSGAVISLAAIQSIAVLVDNTGKRFINETDSTVHEKSDVELTLPNQEAWAIFDQKTIDEKKLISDYNDLGYFASGESWKALAGNMGLSDEAQTAFVDTMERWQAVGEGNVEEEFGATVASTFQNPPYYAALVKPAMQSTYGGVCTDAAARVLDDKGTPIPGLYAAGAVSGHGCFGNQVGNGLTIASAFGIIAAETILSDCNA